MSQINDGYTDDFYVAAVPRLHGALKGKRRPTLIADRAELQEELGKLSMRKGEEKTAAFVAARIVSWERTEPVSAKAVLELQPRLYLRTVAIICGYEPSDEDPAPLDVPESQKN